MEDLKKKIKIRTGVVKRLHKELGYYGKEEESQRAKINKMKSENADAHDVKKQEEVLAETLAMIPDTKTRLENAFIELVQMMDSVPSEDDPIMQTTEWKDADTIRKEVEPMFA